MKKYIYLLSLLCLSLQSVAQSRILPITEMPSSSQSLSLAGVTLGNIQSAYIYNNPSAIFNVDHSCVEYTFGVIDSYFQSYQLQTLTTAYRNGKHAILLGAKHLSMGQIGAIVDDDMNYSESKKRMYSYIINVGYAYQIDDNFSVYSTVGYIEERTVTKIKGCQLNIGVGYNNSLMLFNRNADYVVGAAINNIGGYNYNETKGMLSPLAKVGGSITSVINKNHSVALSADFGWYLPTIDINVSAFQRIGGSYFLYNRYRVNVGCSFQDGDNYISTGIGFRVAFAEFNLATRLAMNTNIGDIYMCGVKLNF